MKHGGEEGGKVNYTKVGNEDGEEGEDGWRKERNKGGQDGVEETNNKPRVKNKGW